MPQNNTIKPTPRWIADKPSDTNKRLFKEHAYPFLVNLAMRGATLTTATPHISEFIKVLTSVNQRFGDITPHQMRTTNGLIEGMRDALRYAITKIHKEIDDGILVPYVA